MSCTLKHDIGQQIRALLELDNPGVAEAIGMREASRWAGINRARSGHRYECWTFSLKLPRDIGKVWVLYRLVSRLQCGQKRGQSRFPAPYALSHTVGVSGCHILAAKLTVALGVPQAVVMGDEAEFLRAIDDKPHDLTPWHPYADWLQERDCHRGEVIAGWLGKKAVKYKYGVPEQFYGDYKKVPVQDFIGETMKLLPTVDIFESV